MKQSILWKIVVLCAAIIAVVLAVKTGPAATAAEGDQDPPGEEHQHAWSIEAENAAATVKCTAQNCPHGTGTEYTATIAAEGKTYYDGSAVTAAVTKTEGFPTEITVGDIYYAGRGETEYPSSTTAPTGAGQYTASVTVSDGTTTETISADYEIGKAPLVGTYEGETIPCNGHPTYPVAVTGFVNGETAGTAAGYTAPTVDDPATMTPGQSYNLMPAHGTADNYLFSYVGGTLVINDHVWGISADGDTATVYCTVEAGQAGAPAYDVSISAQSKTYDGEPAVEATIAADDGIPAETTVGDVRYVGRGVTQYDSDEPPADAGYYTAYATVSIDDAEETIRADFDIAKAATEIMTPPSASAITYGQTLDDSTFSGGEANVPGSFSWLNGSTTKPAVSDSETTDYVVEFTPTDADNYEGTNTTIKVKVNKAGLTAAYAGETIDCNGTPALTVDVTGFVNSETAETAAGYSAPTVTLPASVQAGKSYKLIPANGAADNYDFSYVSGILKVNDHVWGDWKVTKEPTTTEKGMKTRTCKKDPAHQETQEIPMLKEYTITYDLNGGKLNGKTGVITEEYVEGKKITLPKPTKDGYTFDYWKGSRYQAGDTYTVTEDHTLTAQWKKKSESKNKAKVNKVPTISRVGRSTTGSSKTGDSGMNSLWIVILIAAGAAIAVIVAARCKHSRQ